MGIYGFKMWEAFYSQTTKPQAIKRNSNKHVHIKILNFFIEEIPQTRPKKKKNQQQMKEGKNLKHMPNKELKSLFYKIFYPKKNSPCQNENII